MTENRIRHILGISGGKDSAALAVYMRDRVPDMEYVFADTDKELEETYQFLSLLEAYLGRPIVRLNAERPFDHYLKVYNGYLPSSRQRWCTRVLKLKPFEEYVGNDTVVNYVGIRVDEDREGLISTKPNIKTVFPFKEDGITHADVLRILDEAGLGLPKYYEWRSRSGCYFCFFQRKSEWVGLLEKHPDLFEMAKAYEKADPITGERYTWQSGESLEELSQPERVAQIKKQAGLRSESRAASCGQDAEEDDADRPCLICEL
jgi:3'-phosphoadenosine 5'-phosphosulfate sulfotransferase (PAPS reductase)/FAD synthetase